MRNETLRMCERLKVAKTGFQTRFLNYHFRSWSSGNAFVSGAEGLRFKSRAGQIGHSVANGSHRCDISSKGAVLPGRYDAEMGPANSLQASAYYSECNERFDMRFSNLKCIKKV